MTKKEIKELGATLAECFNDGGSETLVEIYNGGADWLPYEAAMALHDNTDLGEDIEEQMNIALAKKYAKFAGGKFIPHGGIK